MDDDRFFSDRNGAPRTQASEELSRGLWGGIYTIASSYLDNNLFASAFPETCPDAGKGICGTDESGFWLGARAWIPELQSIRPEDPPALPVAMDFVEFMFDRVSSPTKGDYHSYFGHHHLRDFRAADGQRRLRAEMNGLFQRNGFAYELGSDGKVVRLGPPVLRKALAEATFNTGDADLDDLLNRARQKFRSPDPALRVESLEKLWDAFERLKSVPIPGNKKQSVAALIQGTGLGQPFQEQLDAEMKALTEIGNNFQIRHWETDKEPIESSDQVDYLFSRLFAALLLLLKS